MRRAGWIAFALTVLAMATTGQFIAPGSPEAGTPARVAVLTPGKMFTAVFEGLRDELARLDYKEGRDIVFIVEDTKGSGPDVEPRALALVEGKPDVLVTVATRHTAAAKKATATIPTVFALVGDPVRSGFVASFASSKNNITGASNYAAPLSSKRLELLKEIAPRITRVLVLVAAKDSIAESSFDFALETAKKLGITLIRRDVTGRDEMVTALRETPPGSVDAIFHAPSALVGAHIQLLIAKAREDRIPLIAHEDNVVERGALLSYGANFRLMGAQAAKIVAKVLAGAKPADIPVQLPEKLVLAVNLSTAKAIGLTIPRIVLERADLIVE